MKAQTAIAVVIVLATASEGFASGPKIKRFDVDAHCKKIAGFGNSYSEQMYNFCFDEEQKEYNALKTIWPRVTRRIFDHCHRIASFGGPGSYQMPKFCVDEELAAKKDNNSKEFKF